ncbi:MAG: MerR family transcriptional regulator [Acidimicrobiia bacterium]
MSDNGGRSIGELITVLRDEFPELSVSKVRFLEGQGLVAPQRTDAGYRMFTDDDVRRIRYILREQRDHFLPLKVIKSKLTAWERGEEPSAQPETGPPPESYFAATGVSLTRQELARAAGLTRAQIAALVGQGILAPMELPSGKHVFRDEDLTIARAARRLLGRGLEERHLRSLRLAADREADLLRQRVSPLLRHRNPDSRREAAEILADGAQAGARLQEEMVKSRIRKLLET